MIVAQIDEASTMFRSRWPETLLGSLISSMTVDAMRFVRPRGSSYCSISHRYGGARKGAAILASAFRERDHIRIVEEGLDPFVLDDLLKGREGLIVAIEEFVPCR